MLVAEYLLDIMGCWPKLRHKVVLAVIGCGARLSSLLSLFTFYFLTGSFSQRAKQMKLVLARLLFDL